MPHINRQLELDRINQLPLFAKHTVFYNSGNLVLDTDHGRFVGYKPHFLYRVFYVSFEDRAFHQTEYFPDTPEGYEQAKACMLVRFDSPLKATNLGLPLDDLLNKL